MDPNIMKVNAIVTGFHDQEGKIVDDSWVLRRKEKYWLFTLDEDHEITDVDRARYEEQFQISPHINSIDIVRYSTLVIDGTEYNNQYVQEHLNDLRILLDQIRTDTLLEEIDG